VHSLGNVAVARRRDLSSSASLNFENISTKIVSEPAIASINLTARYASIDRDSVKFSFCSTFAYSPESQDIRYSLLMVEKTSKEGEIQCISKGFYPMESFNGIAGSIPDTIKSSNEHLYNYICAINTKNPNIFFVGLLMDGASGEIYNATTLEFEDIAPMEGEALPVSVDMERNSATMSSGLDIPLKASISPSIASQEIVWTSSNPEVAIFKENGKLRTLTAGSTTIRATSAVDSNIYAEMQVTVLETDYTQIQLIEAGYLHYMVNFNTCPKKLLLSGELNGTDIALLRYMSGGNNVLEDDYSTTTLTCPLQSLDISQCRIVEGGNPYREDFKTQNDVLGEEMFKWCLFLKEIQLPHTITQIGDNAFYECGNLNTVEIPTLVKSIGYAPFYGCTGIEFFTVAEGNTSFKAVDGVLYNYAGTELVAYPTNKDGEDYQTIETLTKILPYAFNHAAHLKSFSSNLRNSSIGRGAFYNASKLESVNLSTRLNLVDEYAFAKCTALKNITCKRVTPAECADNAFEGVPEDCILNLPDNYDEEYHIASGWNYFTHISTSIEELQATNTIRIDAVEGGIAVSGTNYGELICIYNSIGVLMKQAVVSGDKTFVPLPNSGLYVVQISGFNTKIVVR
ncbi:MAG: leucine-rich repeat protein, partial [Bacteroidaceae bacterium]|nr:leucine-rich repeat protein [Bacteroidaceae bacterium]